MCRASYGRAAPSGLWRDHLAGSIYHGAHLAAHVALGLYALPLVRLIAPSSELIEPTAVYLRIELLGGLPALLNMTMIGFFRGIGDTRTPLVVVLVVEFLSVILTVLLIFGVAGCPRLGIAGAALATVSPERWGR